MNTVFIVVSLDHQLIQYLNINIYIEFQYRFFFLKIRILLLRVRIKDIEINTKSLNMHPQLEAERFSDCAVYIEALNECHKAEFIKKAFGLCNTPKDELNKCLHDTAIAKSVEELEARRMKKKKMEERWKAMKEEEFGKDMKLKKVVAEELRRRKENQQ